MLNRRSRRLRRGLKTRAKIKRLGLETGIARLSMHRTPNHFYGQVISPVGGEILASASSLDKDVRDKLKGKNKTEAAEIVGQKLAENAKKAGVEKLASDRSGFKYHGRLKAFVEKIRENGITV
tara:strand:- start:16530 stop:16898 length:369 start_codon:yes stop_codon:yes gene_type:complete